MRSKAEGRKLTARSAEIAGREGVAEFLRHAYADARAKRIARDFNISIDQAERYLSQESMPSWFLFEMAKTHGWDFVRHVFEPLCGPHPAERLLARVEAHAQANREIIREVVREAIAVVHGDAGGGAGEPAEHHDDVVVGARSVADQAQSVGTKPPAESKTHGDARRQRAVGGKR